MSTHNICFREEIRKILCGYSLLSVAMRVSKTDGKFHSFMYLLIPIDNH